VWPYFYHFSLKPGLQQGWHRNHRVRPWFSQSSSDLCSLIYLCLNYHTNVMAERTCYIPDGAIAQGDQPCFPENPESACCGGSIWVCSTNNMCAYYDGSYYIIGSCTDKTWNSPACPGYLFFFLLVQTFLLYLLPIKLTLFKQQEITFTIQFFVLSKYILLC
jgi:hypothetical protein